MKQLFYRLFLILSVVFTLATFTNCAKSGCPANEALYKESMGEGGGKKSKSSKKSSKSKSGLFPEGKKAGKY